ncbi:restriction modification system DNA specificity domain [Xanthobacter versatilis]|uniref:Restriction modification system DNA specificity domain n=1 Tax=Xanthobacter autotrophicus (strain ATCC BAA-1158 / Py2) TaxID=78245 RepID=A7IEA1_XANP2|nr:restriction modification system DNA specificity domain [Xanthobacter autotrophicus Py2]
MSEARWQVPHSWLWASFGEVADIVGGGTPPTGDEANFTKQGVPWLTPADLTGYRETYISRGRRDLSEKGYRESAARLLPKGTVLFSSRAPVGYCAIASENVSTNQGFKSFILKGDISPEYVRHYLLGSTEYAESKASGTTFKELSGSRATELALPLPPLPEQRRIVAKIDSLTAKSRRARDHLEHIPRLVEKYKQAILAAAFDGRLTELSPHDIVHPELGELIEFGPQNGLYLPKDRYGEGTPILRIQNYGFNFIDEPTNWHRVTVSDAIAAQFAMSDGDLIINRVNSPSHLGKSMVVTKAMAGAIFESNMMRIRLNALAEPKFVQLYLSSSQGRGSLTKDAKWAVNQASINQGDVSRTPVPLPGLSDQIAVLDRIETAFAWIDRLAAEATSARTLIDRLDQAVLAKAFRGELVPQDPADEPASVLLERIRAERGAAPKARRGRRPAAEA